MKALEDELAVVKEERDARAKEKDDAQKAVEGLKQQVAAKALQSKQKWKRSTGAERMKALEDELAAVKERDTRTQEKDDAQKALKV